MVDEPESASVVAFVADTPRVLVSSLTRLEAAVTLKSLRMSGRLNAPLARRATAEFERLLELSPFEHIVVDDLVFDIAVDMVANGRSHCRSLDRLHLAIMRRHNIDSLFTHDVDLAKAAKKEGFDLVTPRRAPRKIR